MNEIQRTDPRSLDPFDDVFRGWLQPWRREMGDTGPTIRLDVSEDEAAYTVRADIPGVRREDIDVRVDGNTVSLSAEVKRDSEEKKDGRVIRSERYTGFASRSFALTSDVDEARADAKYKDGVLTLRLPKKAGSSSRRLSVG